MPATEALSCQDLGYTYPDRTVALRRVSFSIQAGDSVALVGPNGAGKSTLALLAVGVIFPSRGSLRVFGMELSRHTLRQIRRHVGLVFQDADDQLFMPTLLEDVAFGPLNQGLSEDQARHRSLQSLAAVGLEQLAERFPGHLSGGEKKLASLASILSMQPQIVILDEPTAGLDPRARRKVIEQLAALRLTKIVISHDLEMVLDLCPRTILLDKGSVWADGDTTEILSDKETMDSHGLEVPYSLSPDHRHRFPLAGSRHEAEHKK